MGASERAGAWCGGGRAGSRVVLSGSDVGRLHGSRQYQATFACVPPQCTRPIDAHCRPASQQLVGTVTPAFDQPRTPALPLPIVCHLLGSGNQLHPTGLHQLALPLSHHTPIAARQVWPDPSSRPRVRNDVQKDTQLKALMTGLSLRYLRMGRLSLSGMDTTD